MMGRLGNVFYWIGCAIGGLLVIAACIAFINVEPFNALFVGGSFLVAALGAWLLGRACLYVLAGR